MATNTKAPRDINANPVLLLLLACVTTACATAKEEVRPRFSVKAETLSGAGPRCGQKVVVKQGALAPGVRESVRYQVTVSMPVSLAEVEDLLAVEGARVCADGVMVLQAVAEDGVEGVTSVTATAYVNQPDF